MSLLTQERKESRLNWPIFSVNNSLIATILVAEYYI